MNLTPRAFAGWFALAPASGVIGAEVAPPAATELAKPSAGQLSSPASRAKRQTALIQVNQSGALDGFKATLNPSTASGSPQAAVTGKESLKALALTDASGLASGAPDSATKMRRSVAEPVVRAKRRPLVNQAVAANGSAAKIKERAGKAGPFAAMLGVPGAAERENDGLAQVIQTSVGDLARGEAAVGATPAARQPKVAAKIFARGKPCPPRGGA